MRNHSIDIVTGEFDQQANSFDGLCLDSWLERATHQEGQARGVRTKVILAGITSFVVLITAEEIIKSESSLSLFTGYVTFSLCLLFINQFYAKKTAVWADTAKDIQRHQIKLARQEIYSSGEIKICDDMYTLNRRKYKLKRIDGPTKYIIGALICGFLYLSREFWFPIIGYFLEMVLNFFKA